MAAIAPVWFCSFNGGWGLRAQPLCLFDRVTANPYFGASVSPPAGAVEERGYQEYDGWFYTTSDYGDKAEKDFAGGSDDMYCQFRFWYTKTGASNYASGQEYAILHLKDGGSTIVTVVLAFKSTTTLCLKVGVGSAAPVTGATALAQDTAYVVRFRYQADTGTGCKVEVWLDSALEITKQHTVAGGTSPDELELGGTHSGKGAVATRIHQDYVWLNNTTDGAPTDNLRIHHWANLPQVLIKPAGANPVVHYNMGLVRQGLMRYGDGHLPTAAWDTWIAGAGLDKWKAPSGICYPSTHSVYAKSDYDAGDAGGTLYRQEWMTRPDLEFEGTPDIHGVALWVTATTSEAEGKFGLLPQIRLDTSTTAGSMAWFWEAAASQRTSNYQLLAHPDAGTWTNAELRSLAIGVTQENGQFTGYPGEAATERAAELSSLVLDVAVDSITKPQQLPHLLWGSAPGAAAAAPPAGYAHSQAVMI